MVFSLAAADAILGDDAAAAHAMQACMLAHSCFLLFLSSRGPSFLAKVGMGSLCGEALQKRNSQTAHWNVQVLVCKVAQVKPSPNDS